MSAIQDNINWIRSGKIGCVFASALVKQADKIGWKFYDSPINITFDADCFIYTAVFPNKDAQFVKQWALDNGCFIEQISDMYNGLRITIGANVSWVQYFGPDSHVKTRQAPHPMLSFAIKLPTKYYAKVGFNSILHLAHASIEHITDKAADLLWKQSFTKTKKELGFSPTVAESAKTTFKI